MSPPPSTYASLVSDCRNAILRGKIDDDPPVDAEQSIVGHDESVDPLALEARQALSEFELA